MPVPIVTFSRVRSISLRGSTPLKSIMTLPEEALAADASTPETSTERFPYFAISLRRSGTEIDVFDEIQRLRQEGRKAALATIVQIRGSVPSFQSAKMLVRDDGSTFGSVGGGCVEA